MSRPLRCVVAGVLTYGLVGCGGGGGLSGDNPTGTGPFDSRGNYVESWADDPSKWNGRSVPKPSEQEPPQVAQNDSPPVVTPQPRPTQTVTHTPAPKPVAPKPKPKPKPTTTYHTVRKGDTLYGLAKRYGTSVSAIQKANGISGSIIRLNQRLKIPR